MKFSNLARVYVTDSIVNNQSIIIEGDNFHYLKSAIRLKLSAKFRLFNSCDGEFLVEIIEINRSSLCVHVREFMRSVTQEADLSLAMCIIKPDRMLEAIRGAVQIGVTSIIPLISERTQYKTINRDKFEKSIIQSTEQSEHFVPALLKDPMTLESFIQTNDFEQIIFASEVETDNNKIVNINNLKDKIAVLIGPEGGFSDIEITTLKTYDHILPVTLGRAVLRAETAAIAALACVSMVRK